MVNIRKIDVVTDSMVWEKMWISIICSTWSNALIYGDTKYNSVAAWKKIKIQTELCYTKLSFINSRTFYQGLMYFDLKSIYHCGYIFTHWYITLLPSPPSYFLSLFVPVCRSLSVWHTRRDSLSVSLSLSLSLSVFPNILIGKPSLHLCVSTVC